jgi:hypothetical protein
MLQMSLSAISDPDHKQGAIYYIEIQLIAFLFANVQWCEPK